MAAELSQGEVGTMEALVKKSGTGSLAALVFGPALVPILIPLGTGLVWWWLLQWHWLALRRPALVKGDPALLTFHDSESDPHLRATVTDLILDYRRARLRLWFGALFWPVVIGAIIGFLYVTMDGGTSGPDALR